MLAVNLHISIYRTCTTSASLLDFFFEFRIIARKRTLKFSVFSLDEKIIQLTSVSGSLSYVLRLSGSYGHTNVLDKERLL